MENKKPKKRIAILGSTGSIGTQALDVIKTHPDNFEAYAITGNNNTSLLIAQAREFKPEIVIVANEKKYEEVKTGLADLPLKVWTGSKAIAEMVEMPSVDFVLNGLIGYAGLEPTLSAIKARKIIGLANKETMVVAGELVTKMSEEYKAPIIPVDSEHSAIFQCLQGEPYNPIEKILLTASGGPFKGKDRKFLETVTPAMALKHPSWNMGARITIASASMMNKGLEVIEAHWLFGVKTEQIEVLVHPQSVVHSAVQFEDGTVKAQLAVPDMRLPIQYAMSYPKRIPNAYPRLDFSQYPTLTFDKPDLNVFRSLQIAYDAMHLGGNMPCLMNAANEVAISAFLEEKIGFLKMADVVEATMGKCTFKKQPSYEDLIASNQEGRQIAQSLI